MTIRRCTAPLTTLVDRSAKTVFRSGQRNMSQINVAAAKIVHESSHQVSGKLQITEHFFEVPKDHANPEQGSIRLFARSARKYENAITPDPKKDTQLPWLIYFQGGPGMPCRSPHNYPFTKTFLDRGYQMLFLDPRGTGLSTPVTATTLQKIGKTDAQVDYLKLFRADSIVRDAEAIRKALTHDYSEDKKKWSTIGQSFGGFCTLSYLSFYPEYLRESFLFGGLAPIVNSPDDVYRRLTCKVKERNQAYYAKYPGDVSKVRQILDFLKSDGDGNVLLRSGGRLTRRRFLQLGMSLGMHGGLDAVHDIVLRASNDLDLFGHLTSGALSAIENSDPFDQHFIYAILHEPIYCQGQAANWSAYRTIKEHEEFNYDRQDGPIFFTGEMVFPWMLEDFAELSRIRETGEQLAQISDWPALYDEQQLAKNEVPVYAASYIHDMYVDQDLAMETARKVKGCQVFTTNVMFHNAIGSKMEEVTQQLFALRDDVTD